MQLPNHINLSKAAAFVWIVFSVIYILYTSFDSFRNNLLQSQYQLGYQTVVAELLQKSKDCKPFNVPVGNASVDLISMACLQPATDATTAQPNAQPQSNTAQPNGAQPQANLIQPQPNPVQSQPNMVQPIVQPQPTR